MIANVVPAIRTPRHVNVFDYAIPHGMDVRPGDLVKIPFRSRTTVGVTCEIRDRSEEMRGLKEIEGSYAGLHLNEDTLSLLSSLAARSFSSQASVLHAWLGTLPKREKDGEEKHATRQHANTSTTSLFLPNHLQTLLDQAGEIVLSKQKLLILTPWASRADWIAEQLRTKALTSDKAAGERFALWSSFVRNERPVLVATRLGAWLATEADTVILDEPENDDHKQDELSPRYDARWIVEAAQSFGCHVIKIGLTPPLSSFIETTKQHDIPPIQTDMTAVDVHSADWSGIAGIQNRTLIKLENALREGRPAFIIHPVHGDRARLRCKDCSWQANCSRCGAGLNVQDGKLICLRCNNQEMMNLACPVCGGTDLSKSRAGRGQLEKDLEGKNLKASVLSIGEWNAQNDIPQNSLVILTDLSLFAGGVEDLRKKERLIIAFRRLADACASSNAHLVIQSDAGLLAEAKNWLNTEGCEHAMRNELKERELFRLPSAFRLLKMIFRGNEGHAIRQLGQLKDRMEPNAPFMISGPFPVLHRPSHRTPRWIGHVSAPFGTKTEAFEHLIEPLLSSDTLFDLDPIAFFE